MPNAVGEMVEPMPIPQEHYDWELYSAIGLKKAERIGLKRHLRVMQDSYSSKWLKVPKTRRGGNGKGEGERAGNVAAEDGTFSIRFISNILGRTRVCERETLKSDERAGESANVCEVAVDAVYFTRNAERWPL